MTPLALVDGVPPAAAFGGLAVLVVLLLLVDLKLFAPGREPTFREGVVWSIGWLVLSLLMAPVLLLIDGRDAAIDYTTVYLIERSLSLDNLFVFILLFGYFAVPQEFRGRLLFIGIVAALVLRGLAIAGGVALIEQFHVVIYILGVSLLVLAYRMYRGVGEHQDPDQNAFVKLTRRFMPVTSEYHGTKLVVRDEGGQRSATPMLLALGSIVLADIAFAVDSIPAAFAISRDALVIWMANAFALLGLRALFVLVEGLIARFRYLDETIAIVLGIVAVKLLAEDFVKVGPVVSLLIVAVAFAIGMVASVLADRRDPEGAERRRADHAAQGTS